MKPKWKYNKITGWEKDVLNQFIVDIGLFEYERGSEERRERALFFVEKAYEFLCSKEKLIESMNLELMETIISCIDSYNPELGNFVHYLNRSIRNAKCRYYKDKNNLERAIRISAEQQALAKKIISYLNEKECPYLSDEVAEELACSFSVNKKKILEAYQSTFIVAESCFIDEDGEETEMDIPYEDKNILSISGEDTLDFFCDILEKELEKYPKRREMYAAVMTNWTCEAIFEDLTTKKVPWINVLKKHNLLHRKVLKLCYERFKNGEKAALKVQELAKGFKKNNAVISRAKSEIRSVLNDAQN